MIGRGGKRNRGRTHRSGALAESAEQRFHPGTKRRDRRIDDRATFLLLGHVVALLLQNPLFGDVLVGGDPAAVRHRHVDGVNRAAVAGRDYPLRGLAVGDAVNDLLAVLFGIAGEQSGSLALLNKFPQRAARLHHVGRQSVHAEILPIAARTMRPSGIEHAQALRHVIQRVDQKIRSSSRAQLQRRRRPPEADTRRQCQPSGMETV